MTVWRKISKYIAFTAGILSVVGVIGGFSFSIYQIVQASNLLSSQLVANKVDSIDESVNYTRQKWVDLLILCEQEKPDLSAIQMLFYKHQDAAERLLSISHNFKKRLAKKANLELTCYADYHANLFTYKIKNGYCKMPPRYLPSIACSTLMNKYKHNCYGTYLHRESIIGPEKSMEKWGFCVSNTITKETEKRYGINISKFINKIPIGKRNRST